jgi:histidinol-phosphate/aromatic aminotransferase/cobyric acid decarboxylase-like protein
VPSTPDGKIDLDEVHRPIIERIIAAYREQVPALSGFAHLYPTSGSSEGIYHLLTKVARTEPTINTLKGEYEGFCEQGKNIGLKTQTWDPGDSAIGSLPPGSVWFISNPCARDGGILPNTFIETLCELGHKLVIDLAYVGTTEPHLFDLSHPNIMAVVTSFSKPYGTFRLRIGGMLFSREAIPTLYGNKWFKDVQRLFQALAIGERIGPQALYPKYRPVQEAIIAAVNQRFGLALVPADVFLLARLRREQAQGLPVEWQEQIKPFLRMDTYRFCLTPYFEDAFLLDALQPSGK